MRGTVLRLFMPRSKANEMNRTQMRRLIDSNLIRVNTAHKIETAFCYSRGWSDGANEFFEPFWAQRRSEEGRTLNLCVRANHKFPIYAMFSAPAIKVRFLGTDFCHSRSHSPAMRCKIMPRTAFLLLSRSTWWMHVKKSSATYSFIKQHNILVLH